MVFVHGVHTRYDPNVTQSDIVFRDLLFREHALSRVVDHPFKTRIFNPYWGDHAAKFPWNLAGLPVGDYEMFGTEAAEDAEIIGEVTNGVTLDLLDRKAVDVDRLLVATATRSLGAAIDLLWQAAVAGATPGIAAGLSTLSRSVSAYALANPNPGWVPEMNNDYEFVARLVSEAESFGKRTGIVVPSGDAQLESFGIDDVRNWLRRAAGAIRGAVVGARDGVEAIAGVGVDASRRAADAVWQKLRRGGHRHLMLFLGDAFVYFRQRGKGTNEIASIVRADLEAADLDRKKTGEPLIVVAHSMGGNITYDLLTSELAGLDVDYYVTVGSQVAVLEEQHLFARSDFTLPNASKPKVTVPANIRRWINVFDTTDPLGFAAGRVFDRAEDFEFRTWKKWAHSGYFIRPMFHERLGQRMKGAA